jgi:hypothetical protein
MALSLIVVLSIACASPSTTPSGTDSPPSTPKIPADPSPASLQILSGGLSFQLATGEDRQLTAWATYVDRAARSVEATWTSIRPEVATVAASGKITARSIGTTVVVATFMNVTATQIVDVVGAVPDYRGVWVGSYLLASCTDLGQLATAGWCRQLGGIGAKLPVTIGLRGDQNGSFSTLQGTLALGSVPFAIFLSVNQDGTATGGFYSRLRTTPPFVFEFDDPVFYNRGFSTTIRFSNPVSGSWKIFGYYDGGKGNVTEQGDLIALTKDPTLTVADPSTFPPATSVADLIERMKR